MAWEPACLLLSLNWFERKPHALAPHTSSAYHITSGNDAARIMTDVEHARDGGQTDVSLQGNQLEEQARLSTPPGDLNGEHLRPHRARERCLD